MLVIGLNPDGNEHEVETVGLLHIGQVIYILAQLVENWLLHQIVSVSGL